MKAGENKGTVSQETRRASQMVERVWMLQREISCHKSNHNLMLMQRTAQLLFH
jgi:hypothetical protein